MNFSVSRKNKFNIKKVLVSQVGSKDPFDLEKNKGALLSIIDYIKPIEVYIITNNGEITKHTSALQQTQFVLDILKENYPNIIVKVYTLKTTNPADFDTLRECATLAKSILGKYVNPLGLKIVRVEKNFDKFCLNIQRTLSFSENVL